VTSFTVPIAIGIASGLAGHLNGYSYDRLWSAEVLYFRLCPRIVSKSGCFVYAT